MAEQKDIEFTEFGNLGLITLNRPQALNALTHDMVLALYKQLGEWLSNDEVYIITIQGAGDKAFCAGGDIRQVYMARGKDEPESKNFFRHEYRLNHRIKHYPKPYVTWLDGITMGGGVGVSLHGSHRIATERFSFAMPETGIGFFPDVGGSYLLSRCPGETGIYLGLTGARIQTADAMYLGLVDYEIHSDRKAEFFDAVADARIRSNRQATLTNLIKAYAKQVDTAPLAAYRETIDRCFQGDDIETIMAALTTCVKEATTSAIAEWCDKTLTILQSKSPTSLKVALQQLRKGAQRDFEHCLQMEYRMAVRFLAGHDFYEGVRAVIIDKDQKPQWQPATLSAIKQNDVDSYFAPLTPETELELY